jgi:hypothetical protein
MPHRQGFLDFALEFPQNAPREELRDGLLAWNPALRRRAIGSRVSDLEVLTLSEVRQNWSTIMVYAVDPQRRGKRRITTYFLHLARCVRDGRPFQ